MKATTIDALTGTLAIGLVWPDAFTHVVRFNIPNHPSSEVRQVGPIEWEPTAADHYCLCTQAASPQPITFVKGSSVRINAGNSNNIAYRNVTIVVLASS